MTRIRKFLTGFLIFFVLMEGVHFVFKSSWLVYFKPGYEGQVLDIETKKPIEGAIVAAIYYEHIWGPFGSDNEPFRMKETLTDREGRFYFWPYVTLMNPMWSGAYVNFHIYKPGYTTGGGSEEDFYGTGSKDQEYSGGPDKLVMKYHDKIVELSKAVTKEQRRNAYHNAFAEFPYRNKKAIEIINDEEKFLNLSEKYGGKH